MKPRKALVINPQDFDKCRTQYKGTYKGELLLPSYGRKRSIHILNGVSVELKIGYTFTRKELSLLHIDLKAVYLKLRCIHVRSRNPISARSFFMAVSR
jgi:hypothetical protein